MTAIDTNFNQFSARSAADILNLRQEIIHSYTRSVDVKYKSSPSAFTRANALWTPDSLVNTIFKLKPGPLPFQLDEINGFQDPVFKTSAFSQARKKLLPDLFRDITDHVTEKFTALNLTSFESLYAPLPHDNELNMLIYDGVNNPIYVNYKNEDTIECTAGDPRAGYHITTCYDRDSGLILDRVIQPAHKKNENDAARSMILTPKYAGKKIPIHVFDRLFFSYELMSQIQNRGEFAVCRLKKEQFRSMVPSDITDIEQEIDIPYERILTEQNTKKVKENPDLYHHVPKGSVSLITKDHPFFHMKGRLLAIPIPEKDLETAQAEAEDFKEDCYEYLFVLLPDSYTSQDAYFIYGCRWQIEISNYLLKYSIGMKATHSKLEPGILQEIYACILNFNTTSTIKNLLLSEEKMNSEQMETVQQPDSQESEDEDMEEADSLEAESIDSDILLPLIKDENSTGHKSKKHTYDFNFKDLWRYIRAFITGLISLDTFTGRIKRLRNVPKRPGRTAKRGGKNIGKVPQNHTLC